LFLSSLTWAVSEEEMLRNGFSPQMFRNLNTPEELQAAKDQIGQST
jgi:hypothetical protein